MVLSTDIGYSYTKYAYDGVLSKFPSIVSKAGSADCIGELKSYEYGGNRYNIGENAFGNPNISTRTDDFLIKYSPLLLSHIFNKEDIRPDLICVSLSISEYKEKEEKLKDAVSKFIVNNEIYNQEVMVFPQGMGIWVSCGKPDNAVIIDIGYNTVDIFAVKDGAPSRDYSKGFPGVGTCILANNISQYIGSKFNGMFIPELEANKYLQDKKLKILRREYDLSEFIEDKKEDYSNTIINAILTTPEIKNIIDKTDNFIIAGGGAYYIRDDIKTKYKITIPDNPEYANVIGFLQAV
ncbi:MAG: ParM/StbA family protein [bacterium]